MQDNLAPQGAYDGPAGGLGRAGGAAPSEGAGRRWWALAAIGTVVGAGLLFALSASTAQGTDLRASRSDLASLIDTQRQDITVHDTVATRLRRQVAAAAGRAAAGDTRVAAEQARSARLAAAAGLTALRGPGLSISLDDAPAPPPGVAPASSNPDDLVVHQQDLQAVVNALWAGGADALTLMGERVISTSAVRCVGNTVVLHGRVFGPPFIVTAVGDSASLRASLDAEPGVLYFEQFVRSAGLRYAVTDRPALTIPAYQGPLDLTHIEGAQ